MELAASLSKAEIKKSLKEIAKKAKKNVPTPKYLCLSTSESLLKKVPTLLSSSSLWSSLKSAVQVHGCIPELEEYASLKELKASSTMRRTIVDKSNLPKLRHQKTKQLKKDWLSDLNHRKFWSHIFLGVNRTVRTLESFQSIPDASSNQPNPTLECILLDAGWLTSPLGHHISRLCASSGVRLVSVKPLGALPNLFSCTLYKFKKKTCQDNGEDWNLYKIDPQKLYIFEGQDSSEKYFPSDRILTLSELWSYLTRFTRSHSSDLPDHTFNIAHSTSHTSGLHHVISSYQPAVVKLVEPQTEEQRQVQKKRKRKKKRSSLQTGPTSLAT
ncbi:hypothetical protein PHET_07988 [Paragonimus heterotremus]|uniref:Uncharacterized protein n=1 Tax=Paragonimus heterotremus TaxID=100268 RepID=A0A8J4WV03_9TREM|nr:hypothetical protein PHET_07988 [Paragonimus heterotremus]